MRATLSARLESLSPLSLAAIAILLAACLEVAGLGLLASLEGRLLDGLVKIHASGLAPDPDIVIVDIDEASLAKMHDTAGKFPWSRSVHADLVAGMEEQRPRAIVFDLFFADEDVRDREGDRAFNVALKNRTNVYFPIQRLDESTDAKGVPLKLVSAVLGLERTASAQEAARIQLLEPRAVDPAHWRRSGIVNFLEDDDGVGRRYWIDMPAYGWRLPSLPARLGRDLGFPVPNEDDILLHWRGKAHSFQRISYADLHEDLLRKHRTRPPDELKDKVVLIGATATGLGDRRVTPLSNVYPGVEILATAIDNLKNRRWMKPTPGYAQVALAALLLAFVWEAFRLRRYPLEIGVALGVISALLIAGSYLALGSGRVVPVLAPLAFAWSLYVFGAMLAYLNEKKAREHAVRMFSRFLNPDVVKKIVDQGQTVESLSGKARQISILFSDIRGFTSMSETRPPDEIVQLLNRYFSRQVAVVFRHGGTLDKFIGDCIMALWGAPLDDPKHAEHAVGAALEMEHVLEDFKSQLGAAGADFDVGIGIHSGNAVVGFIGAEQKLDYTAIGDAVNLASRIEGLTKKAKSRILVSRDTAEACHNAFEFRSRGKYKVKGRAQEVELFEPRARKDSAKP